MVDNNERVDTPQENTNPVYNEDAVFNTNESSNESLSPADAFGDMVKEASGTPEQPSKESEQVNNVQTQDNEETRYQYWQSQADKEKNENQHLRDELNQMKGQINALSGPAPAQEQPAPAEQEMEFPPPPDRPHKPRGYNREEAYSDPQSASAQYMDEVEEWRDNMDEYNSAKSNYNTAMVQERMEKMDKERLQAERTKEAQIQQSRQMSQLKEHVASQYKMDQAETQDFIAKMSDPKSISMDNLVQLYRMQKGQNSSAPTQQSTGQPSQAFQQTQRAQQVPQPMGVQPSSGTVESSTEDQIMDNMISDFKSKNPW